MIHLEIHGIRNTLFGKLKFCLILTTRYMYFGEIVEELVEKRRENV